MEKGKKNHEKEQLQEVLYKFIQELKDFTEQEIGTLIASKKDSGVFRTEYKEKIIRFGKYNKRIKEWKKEHGTAQSKLTNAASQPGYGREQYHGASNYPASQARHEQVQYQLPQPWNQHQHQARHQVCAELHTTMPCQKCDELQNQLTQAQTEIKDIKNQLNQGRKGQMPCQNCDKLQNQLNQAQTEIEDVKNQLNQASKGHLQSTLRDNHQPYPHHQQHQPQTQLPVHGIQPESYESAGSCEQRTQVSIGSKQYVGTTHGFNDTNGEHRVLLTQVGDGCAYPNLGEQNQVGESGKSIGELENQLKASTFKVTQLKEQVEELKDEKNKLKKYNESLKEEKQDALNEKNKLKEMINKMKSESNQSNLVKYSEEGEKQKRKNSLPKARKDQSHDLKRMSQSLPAEAVLTLPPKQVSFVVPKSLMRDESVSGLMDQVLKKTRSSKVEIHMRHETGHVIRPHDPYERIVLPCVSVSRIGSDVAATFNNAKVAGDLSVILIIFHHVATFNANNVLHVPTRDKLQDEDIVRRCEAVVDMLFWQQEGVYNCSANNKAIATIQALCEKERPPVKNQSAMDYNVTQAPVASRPPPFDSSETTLVVPQELYGDPRITPILMQTIERMQAKGFRVNLQPLPASSIRQNQKIVVPCIVSSRVGSDLQLAVEASKLPGQFKIIVLIYHHRNTHDCKIRTATKDRLEDRSIIHRSEDLIDLVFWQGNMYDCDANTSGIQALIKLITFSSTV